MNQIVLVAHAPLASALRDCVLHVFPDAGSAVLALDVPAQQAPEATLEQLRLLLELNPEQPHLLLCDIVGATPCNVAARLADGVRTRLLAGVNLPMLLRAVSYRHEALDALVARAQQGGNLGVMHVPAATPSGQKKTRKHDQNPHHHQQ